VRRTPRGELQRRKAKIAGLKNPALRLNLQAEANGCVAAAERSGKRDASARNGPQNDDAYGGADAIRRGGPEAANGKGYGKRPRTSVASATRPTAST
jgi:hypothetical protein